MKAIAILSFAMLAAGCLASPDQKQPEGGSTGGTPLSAEDIASRTGDSSGGIKVTVGYHAADGTLKTKTDLWTKEQYLAQIRAKLAHAGRQGAPASPVGEIGTTQQAITSDNSCSSQDLWLYDATYGAMYCLVDTGDFIFTGGPFDVWYHNLGAFWPGKDWGEVWGSTALCGEDRDFNAWGSYTTTPGFTDFNEVQLNDYGCWVP